MKALLALLAFVALHAHAQSVLPGPVPIPLQVQRLAPQLVAFAGSQMNFENLVNGLALGVPVTLSMLTAGGVVQTVTFAVPGGAVSDPAEIARRLETARQQLIATGIATPTPQQLAELVSGNPVPVTTVTAPGLQPGTAAAGGTLPSPARQIQSRDVPVAPQVNTSDSRVVGNTSDSPVPSTGTPAPPLGSTPTVAAPRTAVPAPPAVAAPGRPLPAAPALPALSR